MHGRHGIILKDKDSEGIEGIKESHLTIAVGAMPLHSDRQIGVLCPTSCSRKKRPANQNSEIKGNEKADKLAAAASNPSKWTAPASPFALGLMD